MGAIAAMTEAHATGVVVVANSYEQPVVCSDLQPDDKRERDAQEENDAQEEKGERYALRRDMGNTVFIPLLNANSAKDFKTIRHGCFGRYAKLSSALSEIHKSSISNDEIFSRILDRIAADHILPWTDDTRQEVVFCIETLERAYALASELAFSSAAQDVEKDRGLASQFALASFWSKMHLECILFAIAINRHLSQEVLGEIVDSLRSSVLAYSYARQGVELRKSPESTTFEYADGWTDEDDASVATATYFGLRSAR